MFLGRKLKLIYLSMILQAAMIVKSLPKYCPALTSMFYKMCVLINMLGMQSPRTKACMADSSVTRMKDLYRVLTDE